MEIIGIIIGTEDEPISKDYYNKNKSSLKVLEEYDIYKDYIPYDYAIFAEIKKYGEKNGFNVIPLFGNELSLKECNQCDYIFSIYEGVYSFMNGGYKKYQQYMNILKKTKAKVFPSQKMQQFVIDKHKYLTYFDKKGYKITPTKYVNLSRYSIDAIMKFIQKNKFMNIVIKPELGAFKSGFKVIKNPTNKKVSEYLKKLKKDGYRRILIQQYLSEFNKYGEIKTYWINNKNIYSYRQQWENGDGLFQSQNNIEKTLLNECRKTGRQLIKDIFNDHEQLIHIRIDFACCLDNNKQCRDFFINEIEICPTIGDHPYEAHGIAYKMIAKELIKKCKIISSEEDNSFKTALSHKDK